jgi:diaminohydroxyphosphoribosylaminopyrimidine deaminase/5-amino-6-(5-phosphoribosylamino)uracil reductase
VGIGTVLADDPLLTARPPADALEGSPARQPLRVVFDSRARLPLDSRLVKTVGEGPVVVVASEVADPSRLAALREAGAEIVVAGGSTPADRIRAALSDLGRREITSLFLEGGRTLAASFAMADQIDEARVFVAPILLGPAGPAAEERDQPRVRAGDFSRAGGAVGGTAPEEASATAGGGGSPAATGPARRVALSQSFETVGDDVLILSRFKEW